jgi:short-subunit dehydrogenase
MSGHKVTALVTGASSGLGVEFCRQLAERCDVIIAVARRAERLEALASELDESTEVHCLEADLGTIEGVARTMEAIRQQGPVDYLVNNAGFSTYGHFAGLPIEDQRAMVNLHIDAAITLCRAAVPFMRELGAGSIINVSSLATFLPGKGLAVYGASKAFLNYYSQALQAEVAASGIEVQALCPGYIRTEFHDAMSEGGFDKTRIPGEMWMNADEVVSASLVALGGSQVIVVPGDSNRDLAVLGLQQQLSALQQ